MATLTHAVPPAPTFSQQGFSLVEMAVVLVIFALLIGGILMPMGVQRDLKLAADTLQQLEDAREALLGFLVVNGRLPCPDTDNDGQENGSPGNCTGLEGNLPHATLGIQRGDPYGWLLRYRVANVFTTTFKITDTGDITIVTRGDNPATVGTSEAKFQGTLASGAPAALWSVGKNGRGGIHAASGNAGPAVVAGTDEALNNAGSTKATRQATPDAGACNDATEGSAFCEFDDILVWLPAHAIVNRMVAAGRLP